MNRPNLARVAFGFVPLALVSGAALSANGLQPPKAERPGYICPITGEELPCEKCCPLN
jgi:hypothetical protein